MSRSSRASWICMGTCGNGRPTNSVNSTCVLTVTGRMKRTEIDRCGVAPVLIRQAACVWPGGLPTHLGVAISSLVFDWRGTYRHLEIVCLNWTLGGVSLVPEWRKPFDLLAEGLLTKESRGDRR